MEKYNKVGESGYNMSGRRRDHRLAVAVEGNACMMADDGAGGIRRRVRSKTWEGWQARRYSTCMTVSHRRSSKLGVSAAKPGTAGTASLS